MFLLFEYKSVAVKLQAQIGSAKLNAVRDGKKFIAVKGMNEQNTRGLDPR